MRKKGASAPTLSGCAPQRRRCAMAGACLRLCERHLVFTSSIASVGSFLGMNRARAKLAKNVSGRCDDQGR